MRFPLLGKAVAIGGVLVALMVALQMIGGIVREREARLHEAERSVADSLASRQVLVGPAVQRRCTENWTRVQGEGKERKTVDETREFTLVALPASLDVDARAVVEPRYRGIFNVNGYTMKATLDARWVNLDSLRPVAQHAGATLQCETPQIFVAVGDARGIRRATITVAGDALPVLPGAAHPSHPRGFHAELAGAPIQAGAPFAAEISLELVGTGDLAFAPIAGTTHVALASNWPHPSFGGRFLPLARTITEQGFKASWQLNALATSAPQEMLDGNAACALDGNESQGVVDGKAARCIETFGVAFFDPVNAYVLSDRATKYGLLFIALTFVGVGLVEVLRRLRVHPMQYLLVGSAIAIFFLLLVSLTEHVGFDRAYLAGATACTVLLTFYGGFVLRGWRAGLVFGAGITVLYGALYTLLQLEQSALIVGSLLLFAVLAGVMVATRRVDWYALFDNLREDARMAAGPSTRAVPVPGQ